MDKGIRPYVNAKFIELNAQRKAGTLTNTQFRKNVMCDAMEAFGITLASAATHYNHAFQAVKAATPTEVEGLGRPDDKKGGRKRKEVAAPTVASVIPVDPAALLQGLLNAPAAVQVETAQAVETPAADPNDAGETGEVQTVFNVCKKSDGSVVAEGVSLEEAKALVEAAAKAKKAKLYWV
jgi:hypothetical protein